jgi:drug/metabolite transporter (DMT)-like permease
MTRHSPIRAQTHSLPERHTSTPATLRPAKSARARDLGFAALLLLAFIWGYNWVVMKIGLAYAQPMTFAALRTFLAAVGLIVMLAVLRRPLRPVAVGYTIVIGLLQTTGFVGLLMLALQNGGAGKTSVLTYTMPFWLLLMAWLFLGERVKGIQWVAVGLALAGLLLVLSPWKLQGTLSSLLAVCGAISWAASAVVVKRLQAKRHVDLLSLTTWQMLFGSLPLVALALLLDQSGPQWTGVFVLTLAYNVILGNALAWLLWLYGLRTLSAGAAGLATLITPVIGVVAAWLQLGERPDAGEAAGMALIIGALALVTARGMLAGRQATRTHDEVAG